MQKMQPWAQPIMPPLQVGMKVQCSLPVFVAQHDLAMSSMQRRNLVTTLPKSGSGLSYTAHESRSESTF